jgi:saccharopine dehydrogenase-like NADP-dependent oxidoreductase
MESVALFGGGKIGLAIVKLLGGSGRFKVRVCDGNIDRARELASLAPNVEPHKLDLQDSAASKKLLEGCRAVVSALPFTWNTRVASIAKECGAHYLDLTEDVETTETISTLAKGATTCFVPQCGLAPGFISIAANYIVGLFDAVDSVAMRVGALPIYPTNRLKYNLTWSTEGLINEYLNLCEVIENGRRRWVSPLEGYEQFTLDGLEYEAFNTSGGLGSLAKSLEGKVQRLTYKTIRYVGHRDLIAFLLDDLRFSADPAQLKAVFERSLSTTAQDKTVIMVQATGMSAGRLVQRTYSSTVYNSVVNGTHLGAIQITTAAGACAVLDLLLSGKIGKSGGIVRVEEISLEDFLRNEFGSYYYDEKALIGLRA